MHKNTTAVWGSEMLTKRYETSFKIGYVFPELPYQSFGVQLSYSDHNQQSYYGLRAYDIRHKSMFSNMIFNSVLSNTLHKFKTGLQFAYDQYVEKVDVQSTNRTDSSVGAFFEYSYDSLERFRMVLGIRFDYHNHIGSFITLVLICVMLLQTPLVYDFLWVVGVELRLYLPKIKNCLALPDRYLFLNCKAIIMGYSSMHGTMAQVI